MDYIKLSKKIAYALRHNPQKYGLNPDESGFVAISDLLAALTKDIAVNEAVGFEDILFIVNNSKKKRFEISSDLIRAYYGHTYEVITGTIAEPPEYLYHGTSDIKRDLIIQEGLLSMTRQYVHLSSDIETALQVGKRHKGETVVLRINAKKASEANVVFRKTNDTTWLANYIAPYFIEII